MAMKTIGIISEFNPFHDGHKYLIDKALSDTCSDFVVAIMSGNFVQRGNPALFDKWQRAKKAIDAGVNLVLELPTVFSCASAGQFAFGGVSILEKLGIIDFLAFGSESGKIEELVKAVNLSNKIDLDYTAELRRLLGEGWSYPAARSKLISSLDSNFDEKILSEPNNILAIEYLRHIETLKPFTTKRIGQGHVETASDMRRIWKQANPAESEAIEKRYFDIVRSRVLQLTADEIDNIASAGEGLGNKIKSEIRYAKNLDNLITRVKSKRYTFSRISRLFIQMILNISNEDINNADIYARPLAFDKNGAKLIRKIKETEGILFVDNVPKTLDGQAVSKTLKFDILASDIYNIIYDNDLYNNSDFVLKPAVMI